MDSRATPISTHASRRNRSGRDSVSSMVSETAVAPALVLLLLAVVGLAAASVAFEWARGSHRGTPLTATTLWVDGLGVLLLSIAAAQLLFGYHLSPARAQSSWHRALAWPIVAVVFAHGSIGSWHALRAPLEWQPLLLVAIGVGVGGIAIVQALRMSVGPVARGPAKTRQSARHRALGLAFGAAILVHASLGVWHAVSA